MKYPEYMYRAQNKGLYVVARNFFLLLLNCSDCYLTKYAYLYSGPYTVIVCNGFF